MEIAKVVAGNRREQAKEVSVFEIGTAMRKIFVVTAGLGFVFAGAAHAADPDFASGYDWTGLYLGVHGQARGDQPAGMARWTAERPGDLPARSWRERRRICAHVGVVDMPSGPGDDLPVDEDRLPQMRVGRVRGDMAILATRRKWEVTSLCAASRSPCSFQRLASMNSSSGCSIGNWRISCR